MIQSDGPFDGIYGFSSGGIIAALVTQLQSDPVFMAKVMEEQLKPSLKDVLFEPSMERKHSLNNLNLAAEWDLPPRRALGRRAAKEGPKSSISDASAQTMVSFVIVACAGLPMPFSQLRRLLGLAGNPVSAASGKVKTIHLIGVEDGFKTISEEVSQFYQEDHSVEEGRVILYLAGGHEISSETIRDAEVVAAIERVGKLAVSPAPSPQPVPQPEWSPISPFCSTALDPGRQLVRVRTAGLPSPNTIPARLADQPPGLPLFRVARMGDTYTSYGDALEFISPGGGGDLRQLQVLPGEVVAYCATRRVGGGSYGVSQHCITGLCRAARSQYYGV